MNKEKIKDKIKELETIQSNTNSELFKLRSDLYELELPDKLKEYKKFNDKYVMFNNDVIYYIKEVLDYNSGTLYFKGVLILEKNETRMYLFNNKDVDTGQYEFDKQEFIFYERILEYDEIKQMILDFIEQPIKACKEHE